MRLGAKSARYSAGLDKVRARYSAGLGTVQG